jgi:putative sugar O-methyltransferase
MLIIKINFLIMRNIYSPLVNLFLNLYKKNLTKKYKFLTKVKFLPDYKCTTGHPKSLVQWHNNLNEIKKNLLKKDWNLFLTWKVINNTMFYNDSLATNIELMHLYSSGFIKRYGESAIHENSIGSPTYSLYARRSSSNLIHHAYHLSIFENISKKKILDHETIVEFGGGYGSMCRLIYQMGFKGNYIIYDFSHLNLIQNYYLNSINPELKIKKVNSFVQLKKKKNVYLVSDTNLLKKILNDKINSLFLSTWGFSESPICTRSLFKNTINNSNSILFAFQKKFNDIENFQYFKKNFYRKNCFIKKINHIKNNYYFVK